MSAHARNLIGLSIVLATQFTAAGEPPPSPEARIRDSYLPGIAILLRVELRHDDGSLATEVWDATARLRVEPAEVDLSRDEITLRNGVGSGLIQLDGDQDVRIFIDVNGQESHRDLRHLGAEPITEVVGELPTGFVTWEGIIHVTGDVEVRAGTTLRVQPGTLILIDGVASGTNGSDINIEGKIESLGTSERPISFTASDPDLPWGEIDHDDAVPSLYQHTVITRAGHSPTGGHTGTGPAVRPRSSSIDFEYCSITDSAGKCMQAEQSNLEFFECMIARCVMGPEIDNTSMIFASGYILEMFGEDDNDGIYMHSQGNNQILAMIDSIVAAGDDDAIDNLDSDVTIRGCIIRDFADKGMSFFHGSALVQSCLVVGNDIGMSAKSSDGNSSIITVESSTIVGNRIGMQARNKSDQPDADIQYHATSLILEPGEGEEAAAIQTDYDPVNIRISYSDVQGSWPGTGNIDSDPLFANRAQNDYRLTQASPCIDAGDPDSPLDSDGTRRDMGSLAIISGPPTGNGFSRGRVNDDESLDISDAIGILLYLFAGGELACLDAADIDDNGALNLTDAVRLLSHLFQGGPPPSAPNVCGEDSTEDELGCELPSC